MDLQALVRDALAEDLPGGDLTSELFVEESARGDGWIEARQPAVLSGLEATVAVFQQVDSNLCLDQFYEDGQHVVKLERVLSVSGSARSILRAERTALNFLTHLSGIATLTHQFVEATREWGTEILCTRKTLPGLRDLEIAAVRHGGGKAYRANLTDAVLIKDNHLSIAGGMSEIRDRLEQLRTHDSGQYQHVLADGKLEVSSLEAIEEAVAMGWRHLLLDNFGPGEVAVAVQRWGKEIYLEMSGGVNRDNLVEFARTGVHAISIGALTHSAKAADFSLECEWRRT